MATPAAGYTFAAWRENDAVISTNPALSLIVNGDRTVVAQFAVAIPTYTVALSANPPTFGTVIGARSAQAGTMVTVQGWPQPGYMFTNWTEGGTEVSTLAVWTFPLTSNRALVANFATARFDVTITIFPAATGTATGAGNYAVGENVTVVATPSTGYRFLYWTEYNGLVRSYNPSFTFAAAGRDLVAQFERIPP